MEVRPLTEYLDRTALLLLQDAFSAVAQSPIRICGLDGRPLTDRASPVPAEQPEGPRAREVPVVFDAEMLGRIALEAAPDGSGPGEIARARALAVMRLMAYMIGWLCDRQEQIRTRVEELAGLYDLTAQFTGQHDLKALLEFVAQTVVKVLKAKACSIRMLSEDGKELVIAAVAGLSPEYLNKGPILLSASRVDQQVLSTNECVYLADMGADGRVMYPAEARREGIISALCAPMRYKGQAVGVLRVYTGQAHTFDWFETSLLRSIAVQAAAAIDHARLDEEAARAAEIRHQIEMAGEVQRRMMPQRPPEVANLELGAVHVPSLAVAGDFYDFIELPGGRLAVAVCDVAGKGMRASLLMASIRAMLRSCAAAAGDVSRAVETVNRQLCADTLTADFATLFYAVFDPPTRRVTYVNAGHVPPLLVRDGQFCHLTTGGMILGIVPDRSWGSESFTLHAGDVVAIYTDGLSEALNFADEPFGRERVEKAIRTAIEAGYDAEGIAKQCLWDMRRFAGLQTRFDDTTIVAMRVR